MSSVADVRAAMIRLLGVTASRRDDLFAALAEDPSVGSSPTWHQHAAKLIQLDTAFLEMQERVCYIPAVTEDVRWTVSVSAVDAANGYLRTYPSLAGIGWWLVQDGAELVDEMGRSLGRLHTDGYWLDGTDTDVVVGPPGWLKPGLMSFAVSNGALTLRPLAVAPGVKPRQIAAVRAAYTTTATEVDAIPFGGKHRELRFASLPLAILEAVLNDRDAFVLDPVADLPELFLAAGMEARSTAVAEIGFDWKALNDRQNRSRVALMYGLDDEGVDAALLLLGACESLAVDGPMAWGGDEDERDAVAVLFAAMLENGDVAEAFWNECESRHGDFDAVSQFAEELFARIREHDRDVVFFGLLWLRSQCLEFSGRSREGIEMLEGAVGPDCSHAPALLDAAAIASDRGDARLAARLVLQAGIEDEPDDTEPDDAQRLWREVAGYASNRPKPIAQRNERCPCGSGKKYKACHLGTERHSLDERASWLWDKAARFVRRHDTSILTDLAEDMAEHAAPRVLRHLINSPFTMDLALHEHGMFADFLEARGWLLPDDEQLLAAQWALVDRSVFEVIDGAGDDDLRLRDIGRGETITIVNATASPDSRPGVTMVGRPLPIGDTYRALGGFLPIPRALVNPMLDAIHAGDLGAVTELIASTLQPPSLRNTSGEELSFHTIRWDLSNSGDVGDIATAFAEAGLVGEDGDWALTADTNGLTDAVLAEFRLEPETNLLVVTANSDARAALARERVDMALPSARLISDERKTLAEIQSEQSLDVSSGQPFDQADPDARAFVEEFIAAKEAQWIDEQIPALGGRTPREAVEDPVGREEVLQLLDSFPEPAPGGAAGFSARRLRALLGL